MCVNKLLDNTLSECFERNLFRSYSFQQELSHIVYICIATQGGDIIINTCIGNALSFWGQPFQGENFKKGKNGENKTSKRRNKNYLLMGQIYTKGGNIKCKKDVC